METIVGISGAATMASLMVSIFKLGVPGASSALIAVAALVAGQVAALAVTAAEGSLALGQRPIGTLLITGVLAAAAAAGIDRTSQTAEARRTPAARND